ncbi:MAG: EAL domain-containing protein [Pseudomonadota bacterium]
MQRRWTAERVAHLPFRVMFWPLFSLALLAGLWGFTLVRAAEERARLELDALAEVGAAAQAYEQYVTRSVANMDQVSMQLKQSWEQSGGALQLGDMVREGMFLDSAFACVAIVDRLGVLRTAIRPAACGTNLRQADFFGYHKDNNTSGLRISPPSGPRTSSHEAILFSRRIDSADGEFDGVVLVSVRADYFTTFYLPATLRRDGMVATAGAESGLRVEQHRSGAAPTDTALPYDAGLWSGPSAAAVVRARQGFPDGRSRMLGWHRSPVYPLVGLVAVSDEQAMAPYARFWSAARNTALLGTLLIILLGALGTTLAWRAAARQRAGEALRKARHVAELQRLSDEDVLTGLPNRQWLLHYLPKVLAHALAAGSEVALLLVNLDEFKYVNDAHGHAAGDSLLAAAAQRLKSLLRPSDRVVRFGGDEFVVLLVPADSDAHTERVAARIVDAFAAPFALGAERLDVGASVGVAVFPRDAADAAKLLKDAAIAMDAAKSEGKRRYRFYEASLARTVHAHVQMKKSLLDAIEQDQFVLYYQPRVDALSGELCSMEALLRWVHPQRGLVPPLDFIPLAEASGLILPIGELVMDKACAQLAAWRAQGLPLVPVSINVSPRQFASGEVHRELERCLARHATPVALLEVEITESAMMGDQEHIIAQLGAIRALGVKLHVDDFGTGYSSLSQLQKLKMDVLKVDRAFTSELGQSREGKVFFQAIVSMAHALGMLVVAEGVETADQLGILQELACNEVQGYYIARPMPAAAMADLMRRGGRLPRGPVPAAVAV